MDLFQLGAVTVLLRSLQVHHNRFETVRTQTNPSQTVLTFSVPIL